VARKAAKTACTSTPVNEGGQFMRSTLSPIPSTYVTPKKHKESSSESEEEIILGECTSDTETITCDNTGKRVNASLDINFR
jgi:hypothetical protein